MNWTVRWIGVGVVFVLCLGVAAAQQPPVSAEPQAPGRTAQAPSELVPTLPVPRLVKFAGTFKDEQGQPRTGVVGVTFALYKEQEGGAALWVETQNVELDEQGRYTVLLGATKSDGLPLELFVSGEPRWLGVQVNLPKELEQPRVLLVSVPYALKAADAETLGGKPFSAFVLATPPSEGGAGVSKVLNAAATTAGAAATIGGGGTQNVVAKFDATGVNVINASISDNGSRINAGEGIDFSSDFSFVGNANPAATGRVQMFDRAFVGFVVRGLNVLFETLQGNPAVPTEVMRVTQAGNVGIGTTTPGQKLSVAGMIQSTTGGIMFPDGSTQTTASAGGTITGVTAGAGLSGGGTSGNVMLSNTGVLSFNGRSGLVAPATNDYSFSQLFGMASKGQLPGPTAFTDQPNGFAFSQTINSGGTALTANGTGASSIGVQASSNDAGGVGGVFTNSAGGKILSLNTGTNEVFFADANGLRLQSPLVAQINNDATTGTVLNELAKFTSKGTVTVTSPGETGAVPGIVVANAGTAATQPKAIVALFGQASCVFDNTAVVADFFQVSPTMAGQCHDAGPTRPTTGPVLGVVIDPTTIPPKVVLFGGR